MSTGKLSKGGIDKALTALRRFRVLADLMGIADVHVIATAAARDASNGPDFLLAARDALGGREVKLLSGQREARLSALGVLSGVHEPDGVVGDLGGGSLELIDVKGGVLGEGVSLPLGGLALMDASHRSPKAAARIVRDALARCPNLDALQGRTFYAVGGTWRSLAKLHMGQRDYPLLVMHGYTIPAEEAAELAGLVERADANAFLAIESVNAARRPLLAYGAAVLNELIARAKPREVVISTYGVREGLLYEGPGRAPARRRPAAGGGAKAEPPAGAGPRTTPANWPRGWGRSSPPPGSTRRLGSAACARPPASCRRSTGAPIPTIAGCRASTWCRAPSCPASTTRNAATCRWSPRCATSGPTRRWRRAPRALMPPKMIERAGIVGACLRVASVLAAGMPGVLPSVPLTATRGKVVLSVPRAFGRTSPPTASRAA